MGYGDGARFIARPYCTETPSEITGNLPFRPLPMQQGRESRASFCMGQVVVVGGYGHGDPPWVIK